MKNPFAESLDREINAMEQSVKALQSRIERIKMLYKIDKLKDVV